MAPNILVLLLYCLYLHTSLIERDMCAMDLCLRGPHLPHWQVSKIPTFVRNSFFYSDKFLSKVWKLVRSHHHDALQFPEITNLSSVKLILTIVRMKYLSRHIFSLKQQLVLSQNRLRRFDSDKCQWGRCMAQQHFTKTWVGENFGWVGPKIRPRVRANFC